MSNEVGPLYRNVIAGVIRDARADFEDLGEDASVLEMLRKEWRKRLTDMKITGDRPWDETEVRAPMYLPPLPAMPAGQAPAASGAGNSQDHSNGGQSGDGAYANGSQGGVGGVKVESDAGGMPNLFVKAEQTDNSPQGSGFPDMLHRNGQPAVPSSVRDMMSSNQDDEVRLQANPPPESQQVPQIGLSSELRQQLESVMSKEGERPNLRQTDGPQDEEVNSDLDDSEDDDINNEDEDDGEQSQIMLCLYDKVQRVKNKWKYTLKDGVANVNGLDYVFSKATGESEW